MTATGRKLSAARVKDIVRLPRLGMTCAELVEHRRLLGSVWIFFLFWNQLHAVCSVRRVGPVLFDAFVSIGAHLHEASYGLTYLVSLIATWSVGYSHS